MLVGLRGRFNHLKEDKKIVWKLGSHSSTDITSFSDDVEKSQAGKMDRLAEVE